jgi:L-seryl-tRNA(Ser) seleniumtransferase
MLLKVHRSNFSIRGFVAEVGLPELVEIGREHDIPVVEDLGSGALVDLGSLGIGPEPTVQASLQAGAQVVTFSGDKLLGGPQAGVLVGEAAVIQRLARDPMARALRLDKLTIAALESTLRAYLTPERALAELPTLWLLTRPAAELAEQARHFAAQIVEHWPEVVAEVIETTSQVGGGAQPEAQIASWGVALTPPAPMSAQELLEQLRHTEPPVIGRIELDRLIMDVRTLLADEPELIAAALGEIGVHMRSR